MTGAELFETAFYNGIFAPGRKDFEGAGFLKRLFTMESSRRVEKILRARAF